MLYAVVVLNSFGRVKSLPTFEFVPLSQEASISLEPLDLNLVECGPYCDFHIVGRAPPNIVYNQPTLVAIFKQSMVNRVGIEIFFRNLLRLLSIHLPEVVVRVIVNILRPSEDAIGYFESRLVIADFDFYRGHTQTKGCYLLKSF